MANCIEKSVGYDIPSAAPDVCFNRGDVINTNKGIFQIVGVIYVDDNGNIVHYIIKNEHTVAIMTVIVNVCPYIEHDSNCGTIFKVGEDRNVDYYFTECATPAVDSKNRQYVLNFKP